MRVAVDARVLSHRPTGVARYLRGVLGAMAPLLAEGERLELWLDGPPLAPPPAGLPWRALRWPLPGGDPAWRQLRLPPALARRRPDVLFCPFYTVPLATRVPRVVTVHDVSFAAHPEWFRLRSRLAFGLVGPSLRRAARVLTPSRFSADELRRRYGVGEARIRVTPLGLEARWHEAVTAGERAAARSWLGCADPFLLHLGAVHERRNVDLLLRAFSSIASRHPALRLVVGGPLIEPGPDLPRLVRRLDLEGRVLRREWVPEEHLRGLLAEAAVLASLSRYEGFGLPALEALACGTAVVALRRASLPEVLGEQALWVEREDTGEVAAALERALEAPSAPDRLVDHARGFGWDRCARLTLAALREALRRS